MGGRAKRRLTFSGSPTLGAIREYMRCGCSLLKNAGCRAVDAHLEHHGWLTVPL